MDLYLLDIQGTDALLIGTVERMQEAEDYLNRGFNVLERANELFQTINP